MEWFNKKFKSQYLEIDILIKNQYERKNPIDWENDKCVICKMPLKIDPTNHKSSNNEMTYGVFFIRFEHKFLRNIYSYDELTQSEDICSLENYYTAYDVDDDIDKLKSNIELIEIKNYVKSNKIPKFNLKLYALVYNSLIEFPRSKFNYETITTNNFFGNVHKYIKVKIDLHHSHITGEIFGYSHDFCNWKVKESKNEILLIAQNLFGFDMFYFIKGYRASAWGSKDLNFGGNNLTNINSGNIGNEIKFIDTLKYYQKSLGELASTLTENENKSVKTSVLQFLNQHHYFGEISKFLSDVQ